MENKDLIEKYKKSDERTKRKILKDNKINLNTLIKGLDSKELSQLAELYPDKEVLCDFVLNKMKNLEFSNTELISEIEELETKGIFGMFTDVFNGKNSINKKIKEMKGLKALVEASNQMTGDYGKLDVIDSNGNYPENLKILENGLFVNDLIVNRKISEVYSSIGISKNSYMSDDQVQKNFRNAYTDFVDDNKKDIAEVFGICEFSQICSNPKNKEMLINSVEKVTDFVIKGENIGGVFLVNTSKKSDFYRKDANINTDIYRKNNKNGKIENIGCMNDGFYKDHVSIQLGKKELYSSLDEISYKKYAVLTSNEIHSKALIAELKKEVGENTDIAELCQVENPKNTIPTFVVKTFGENKLPLFKVVQLNDVEGSKKEKSNKLVKETKIANPEKLKRIALPISYSNTGAITRGYTKVDATIDLNGESFQIYTDKKASTRIAKIVDGKNAYQLVTRSLYKNKYLLEKNMKKDDDNEFAYSNVNDEKQNATISLSSLSKRNNK